VLRHAPQPSHPDLIVGTETGDDATVWRRPEGRALVSTADFFTPLIDDAHTWGRIAATNAGSDVYAMGGTPLFALNLVAWPRDELSLDLLSEVLAGGIEAAAAGGWIVAGGHTVDGPEPMYGQSVTGEIDPDDVLTNAGAQPGDALILTKPIGTGILATAVKRSPATDVAHGGPLHQAYTEAVREMTRHNAAAVDAVRGAAHACTDVTGFGLLGHLHKMMAASGTDAVIDVAAVPTIAGVDELIDRGHVPGGTERNAEFVAPHLDVGSASPTAVTRLADAQTSGGLLVSLPAEAAQDAVQSLAGDGHTAAVIGEIVAGEMVAGETPGQILLR